MTGQRRGKHLLLLVPDLLQPLRLWSRDYDLNPRVPALARLLGRAEPRPGPGGLERALCAAFGLEAEGELAAAALTYRLDTGRWPPGPCLRADPVFLQAGADSVQAGPAAGIDHEQAQALVTALNAHFDGRGGRLEAPVPERWYLHLCAEPGLHTRPLAELAGRDLRAHLPQGPAAARWQAWLTEAQMLLHQHPVNQARRSSGLAPINSLWLWGGAPAPAEPPKAPAGAVYTSDPLGRALADAAGIEAREPPPEAAALPAADWRGGALVVLDELTEAARADDCSLWEARLQGLDRAWFAPLDAALRRGRLHRLELWSCDGRRFCLGRWSPWRLWRRPRPLVTWVS